jgi:hypothetical protein
VLYGPGIAVCSEINTRQINTLCEECQFLSFEPVGAQKQQDLKV